jgi:hypothetical protein
METFCWPSLPNKVRTWLEGKYRRAPGLHLSRLGGSSIADRPRTDPYERFDASGSYLDPGGKTSLRVSCGTRGNGIRRPAAQPAAAKAGEAATSQYAVREKVKDPIWDSRRLGPLHTSGGP